jgi:hypothetical protein
MLKSPYSRMNSASEFRPKMRSSFERNRHGALQSSSLRNAITSEPMKTVGSIRYSSLALIPLETMTTYSFLAEGCTGLCLARFGT